MGFKKNSEGHNNGKSKSQKQMPSLEWPLHEIHFNKSWAMRLITTKMHELRDL